MTLKFKRSKKLENALRCMRELQINPNCLHRSPKSFTSKHDIEVGQANKNKQLETNVSRSASQLSQVSLEDHLTSKKILGYDRCTFNTLLASQTGNELQESVQMLFKIGNLEAKRGSVASRNEGEENIKKQLHFVLFVCHIFNILIHVTNFCSWRNDEKETIQRSSDRTRHQYGKCRLEKGT